MWSVRPVFKPVRSGEERRRVLLEMKSEERRRGAERRGAGPRPPWIDGWLCFDSGVEIRRLMPIPEGWEQSSPDELERYSRRAEPSSKIADIV